MKKYYRILGLKKDATKEEIISVYKKLSKIYHPDMPDTGNEEMFKKINHAFNEIKKNDFVYTEDYSYNTKDSSESSEDKHQGFKGKENKGYSKKDQYQDMAEGVTVGFFAGLLSVIHKIFLYPLRLLLNLFLKIINLFIKLFSVIINILKNIFLSRAFKILLISLAAIYILILISNEIIESSEDRRLNECILIHGNNITLDRENRQDDQFFEDGCYCSEGHYKDNNECVLQSDNIKISNIIDNVINDNKMESSLEKKQLNQEQTIEKFFSLIDDKNFKEALDLMTENFKEGKDEKSLEEGYRNTLKHNLFQIRCEKDYCSLAVDALEGSYAEFIIQKYYFKYTLVYNDYFGWRIDSGTAITEQQKKSEDQYLKEIVKKKKLGVLDYPYIVYGHEKINDNSIFFIKDEFSGNKFISRYYIVYNEASDRIDYVFVHLSETRLIDLKYSNEINEYSKKILMKRIVDEYPDIDFSQTSQSERLVKNQECFSNKYDCLDFVSQKEAQIFFENCGGRWNDINILDKDNDGIACEWNEDI